MISVVVGGDTLCNAYIKCIRTLGLWSLFIYTAWFQLEWHKSWISVHITVKELLPIVLVVAMWWRVNGKGNQYVASVLMQHSSNAQVRVVKE